MDMKTVGAQICLLRRQKGLTQAELGQRLGITFQAVSKWERGETLPDTAILVDLADVLETTVDSILTGGQRALGYRGRITVEQAREGVLCLKRMGELLGKENPLYVHAIGGINGAMNTTVEDAFSDDRILEFFVAEAVIQAMVAGKYLDPTDVMNGFRDEKCRDTVLNYCGKYGIK